MTTEGSCSRCGAQLETGLHVMRDCIFAKAVWKRWQDRGLLRADFFSLSCADWLLSNCSCTALVLDNVAWFYVFVTTLWRLWKSRNILIFQHINEVAGDVWAGANSFAKEIAMVHSTQVVVDRAQRWVKWYKPGLGEFILNTDGASKSVSHKASAGGLIRNDEGQWMKGFVLNIGTTDSLFAESWGVREGLMLAKSSPFQPLIVELDAAIVVQFLKEGVGTSHPCFTIVQDCRCLMQGEWVKEVRHIWREWNQCADKLASLAQDYPPGITVLEVAPTELDQFLLKDMLGNVTLHS